MLSVQSIVKKQVDRLVENMTTELPPPLPGGVNEVFPVGVVLLNIPSSYQLLDVFPKKYNRGVDDVLSMDGTPFNLSGNRLSVLLMSTRCDGFVDLLY